MVRPVPIFHTVHDLSFSPIPLAIGLFVTASLLVALCAKHAGKSPKEADHTSNTSDQPNTPKSPLLSPKKMITSISHKAMIMMPLVHCVKPDTGLGGKNSNNKLKEESIGLWQKAILMGEKCQPLEYYPGVIYYDYSGKRISEMPMSPRASAMLSPLRNYSFPIDKRDKS